MENPLAMNDAPIDAVITWVDGRNEDHQRRRFEYMAKSRLPLHENATNPHRWACSDEILYCLQSIENHASWIRTIWIVVECEVPNLSSVSEELRAKIKFAFHRDIFDGFTEVLPTFNSLSIESMIWRIDDLSERFIYFNDDVFLTAPLRPEDVFEGLTPVLRGKWVNLTEAEHNPSFRSDPSKFNHFMQINAAKIIGFDANSVFCAAHVAHPIRRSTMAQLFGHHQDLFKDNIAYRFRDLRQFLPQGLHNHACIAANDAIIQPSCDYLHIRSGQGKGGPPAETWAVLESVSNREIKFLCVNDLPQLEEVIPEARDWLWGAVGGFPVGAHRLGGLSPVSLASSC